MMKNYFTVGAFMVVGLISFQAVSNSSGANAGHTGSPASNGNTCTSCHGGPAVSNESISVTSDIPADGFVPNTEYTFTVSINDGGTGVTRAGFQASVEGATGSGHIGSVLAPSNEAKVVGGDYVTHTSSGNSVAGGTRSWDFKWNSGSAPDTGVVYVAVNFSNNNGATSGDVIATATEGISMKDGIGLEEEKLSGINFYPNPTGGDIFLEGVEKGEAIMIYNIKGELLRTNEAVLLPDNRLYLNIADFNTGLYLIRSASMDQAVKLRKY